MSAWERSGGCRCIFLHPGAPSHLSWTNKTSRSAERLGRTLSVCFSPVGKVRIYIYGNYDEQKLGSLIIGT